MGAGNRTQVLCKSSMCPKPLSNPASLLFNLLEIHFDWKNQKRSTYIPTKIYSILIAKLFINSEVITYTQTYISTYTTELGTITMGIPE